jgi:ABC-type glycerol-3-phosphate transport system permease component
MATFEKVGALPMTIKPRHIQVTAIYLVAIVLSFFFLLPFLWMLLTSLKAPDEIFTRIFPETPRFSNYIEALSQPTLPFGRFFLNTTYITVFCTVVSLFMSSIAAYGFTRLQFPGREPLFFAILATMMVPWMVMMIPTFFLFQQLGWVDTFLPFMVPAMCGNPFQIFFLRQFFKTIPNDLFDAAKIDGCSNFRILLSLVIPLSKPPLATLAIFAFLFYWNDFMGPLIYLHSTEVRTVALGLFSFSGLYGTEWQLMMAASMVAILPVIILFFSLQKYFEQGIVLSGMKS